MELLVEPLSRISAFFRSFGFDSAASSELAGRFASESDPLRRAQDAAMAWLANAAGLWAAESPAGFAAARAAFVRAGMAARFPDSFLADHIPDDLKAAFADLRPRALPALVPGQMPPQDVRMMPFVDDVLTSVLPLAPKGS
jgi:succinylarginine dihydrolase